ncbi:S8 family serine peptidase [Actinokineospora sp. UTMC 2448]|uniref:S8 family serine peptidase n=1 Tax=Actinokineospora sp. UTMC 2448 TaxID=2268449 RepID=UPI002164191A|nr:S8 family serine peptidase [Actinokineospora sp. UTMC 2448]UVS78797.1 Serine protease AprX [Actinokineospora sp. UTMC 2448]
MSPSKRLVAGVGVVAVLGAAVTPTTAAAASGPGRSPHNTVTLVTGDKVTLVGDRVRVRAGAGREHVRFVQRVDVEGDVHVVPSDVATDVAAGRIDERLFDVGGLIRAGYDDARSAVTPLIITYDGPVASSAGQVLASVNGVAVEADKANPFLSGPRASGVSRIWLDGPVRASLDRSVPQIGAPAAWEAGHTGAGTTVAVLDTGIDETHPDLAGAVVESRDFSDSDSTDDRFGHGTHVASIVTGDGKYKGVAPDAKLLNGKVLNDYGGGRESDIIAGMEWAAAAGADVINMSLGAPFASDGTDPMSLALNRITADTGALFVVSAGNSGPSAGTIGSPAAADAALTVGAVDRDDTLADFSSRGPRWKDNAIKPDITAPGVGIVAAKAAEGQIGDPVGDKHVALSGTSMSAPHVAGAAAVLAGQHPDWSPEQLKAALMASAKAHPDLSVHEQGAGRVDLARATAQSVTTAPASLSLGTARWPHDDDAPIVKTLTYRNHGTAPLTLRVSADLRDGSGAAAPDGMLTVTPGEVTVPAGGQAEVTVTAITNIDAPDGTYQGAVVATDGTTGTRTPIGLTKEVESYDVELSFIDADGKLTPNYSYRFVDTAHPAAYLDYAESGTLTARVPKGVFFFDAWVQTPVEGRRWPLAQFHEPALAITGDTEIVVDARDAKQVGVTVDQADAVSGSTFLFFSLTTDWGSTGTGLGGDNFEGIGYRPSVTTAAGKATFQVESRLARPSGDHEYVGSPYQYNVAWSHDGAVPADLLRHFADRDLVKVATRASGPGTGFLSDMAGGPLPLAVTEYYSPGVAWHGSFSQMAAPNAWPPQSYQSTAQPREFTRDTGQRWNAAVFGPAFPTSGYRAEEWAARAGDEILVSAPMFTDQDPNHVGFSSVDTAMTTLHRGDALVGESDQVGFVHAVDPGGEGGYRLRTEATRSVSPLSTKVSADWTFRSAPTGEAAPLPLLAVRFAPKLDELNRAPAGRVFTVPVYVQRNGSTAEGVRTPAVQVSYDDGATWRPVGLVRVGERWHAVLLHPRGAEFVSLKAQARDAQGNTVDQTIIRAYALK